MPPSFPSLVKPPRWAVNRSLLSADGKNLTRGLVNLLPFWDDSPTDLGHDSFGAKRYGWFERGTLGRGITSHGAGWSNAGTSSTWVESDTTLDPATYWTTNWTELWVVTCDVNAKDSGLRNWGTSLLTDSADLLWFDTTGTAIRMGITGTATVYGPEFHTAADNGKAYVLVVTNDDTNTHTNVLVDGVNHISSASKVSDTVAKNLIIAARGNTEMYSTLVTYARWNRVLTDAEVQTVSNDPFVLLRRNWAIPTVLATSGTAHTATITDPVGVTDSISENETNRDTVTEPISVTDATSRTVAASRTLSDTVNTTDVISPAKTSQSTATDPVGVTDSVSVVLTRAATATDPVGVSDATTAVKSATATVTDPVTTTDAVSTVKTISETITDPVSVTDATSSSKSGDKAETVTESIAVTDAVSRIAPAVRSISNDALVTDSTSTAKTIIVTVTEAINAIDAISSPKSSFTTVTEPITVIDATSRTRSVFRVISEPITVTDSPSRIATAVRLITDPITITDATTGVLSVAGLVTCIGFKRHPDPSLARNPGNAGTRTPPGGGCSSP